MVSSMHDYGVGMRLAVHQSRLQHNSLCTAGSRLCLSEAVADCVQESSNWASWSMATRFGVFTLDNGNAQDKLVLATLRLGSNAAVPPQLLA